MKVELCASPERADTDMQLLQQQLRSFFSYQRLCCSEVELIGFQAVKVYTKHVNQAVNKGGK